MRGLRPRRKSDEERNAKVMGISARRGAVGEGWLWSAPSQRLPWWIADIAPGEADCRQLWVGSLLIKLRQRPKRSRLALNNSGSIMDDIFVAEQVGPPRRRFWISRNPPPASNTYVGGWVFIYDEMDAHGEWRPGWDTWEEWCFEILRYPLVHAVEPLVWRREATGEIVDMAAIQLHFDGKHSEPDE